MTQRVQRWVVWDVARAKLATKQPTSRKNANAYADAMEAHSDSPMLVIPA